ncbi:MAG: hypothetical protein ACREYD_10965 [Casimicrobiaceae bacterium]
MVLAVGHRYSGQRGDCFADRAADDVQGAGSAARCNRKSFGEPDAKLMMAWITRHGVLLGPTLWLRNCPANST